MVQTRKVQRELQVLYVVVGRTELEWLRKTAIADLTLLLA